MMADFVLQLNCFTGTKLFITHGAFSSVREGPISTSRLLRGGVEGMSGRKNTLNVLTDSFFAARDIHARCLGIKEQFGTGATPAGCGFGSGMLPTPGHHRIRPTWVDAASRLGEG